MMLDYLALQETVRFEVMLINTDLPSLLSVRCKEALAKEIMLAPNKVLPPLFLRFIVMLIFLGDATFVYILGVLLQLLPIKTG